MFAPIFFIFILNIVAFLFVYYMGNGSKVETLGDVSVVVGDDFYAYSCQRYSYLNGADEMVIRVWDGNTFSDANRSKISEIFPGITNPTNSTHISLTQMDDRLIINWNDNNGGDLKVGYTTFNPAQGTWSEGVVMHSHYRTSQDKSTVVRLNATTFIEMSYRWAGGAGTSYIHIGAHQFQEDNYKYTLIDSFWTKRDEYPEYRAIWQPGGNFFAIALMAGDYYNLPSDSLRVYSLNNLPNGTMQFNGNPSRIVVSQKTISAGMGSDITQTYSFQNGVINEYNTSEYGKVIDSQPNNGSIENNYYTCLSSKYLAGLPFSIKEKQVDGAEKRTTTKSWSAVPIDTIHGVYFQKLNSESVKTDGVTNIISYAYNSYPYYQVIKSTETNSDGIQRITEYKYAHQKYSSMNNSALHILSPVYSTTIKKGASDVESKNWTTWSNTYGQWLPQEEWLWIGSGSGNDLTAPEDPVGESVRVKVYSNYNSFGNVLQTIDANGNLSTTKWEYSGLRPTAVIKNGSNSETSFLDFEDGTTGDWSGYYQNFGSASVIPHTGAKSRHFSGTSYGGVNKIYQSNNLNTSGKYILSGWVKTSSTLPRLLWKVQYNNGSSASYPASSSASGTGEWQYLELTINLSPYSNITYIQLFALNGKTSGYAECRWDDLRFYPADAEMTTFTYDPVTLQPTSYSDANSNPIYFSYDNFQRLSQIRNYKQEILESYSYFYSRSINGSFNPTYPNYTEVKRYRSASDYSEERSYTDGLGRNIQNHIKSDGGNTIVSSTTTYDAYGRVDKVYKPFERVLSAYDPSYSSHISSYYNADMGAYRYNTSTVSYLYNQNIYNGDPLNRITRAGSPGSAWRINGGYDKYFIYSSAAGNLYKTQINDEQSVISETYKDRFGRTTKTIQDVGSGKLNLTTTFTYDILDNLLTSTDPSGKITSYAYNTLSQLTQKISPDAGTAKYLYDKNGNLRFIQDANHYATAVNNIYQTNMMSNSTYNGSFTLNGKGSINIQLYTSIWGSGFVKMEVKTTGNVVLATLAPTSSNPHVNLSVTLPKGTYNFTVQASSAFCEYYINCSSDLFFIYNKYDKLNRVTETGEYNSGTLYTFSQANAENADFEPTPI